ncbi:hypothetical protein N311_07189, partial [Apaloderma vittatum]
SKKVQAIYLWWHKPVIDRELLHLVSHKMQKPKYAGLAGKEDPLASHLGHYKKTTLPFKNCVFASVKKRAKVAQPAQALLPRSSLSDLIHFSWQSLSVTGHHMAISSGLEHCEANFLGVQVTGAALGIISMGSTGYEIALRAKAFAMNILYHNRTQRKEQEEHAVGTAHCERVDDLLRQEDFVMVVVNLTPQTHKLTGKRELELMKPTATLINISRALALPFPSLPFPSLPGAVVDQEALAAALRAGVSRAAALDVTYPEPLPRMPASYSEGMDHALLKLKNVLIAPHLGIKTDKATDLITEEAVENILSALNG